MIRRSVFAQSVVAGLLIAALGASVASASSVIIDTGPATGEMAMASRPGSGGTFEIETGDDFDLAGATAINHASFTGLIVPSSGGGSPSIQQVVIEIYRVFPFDSDVSRTSGSPAFSTSNVPTRVNSPSDGAYDSRDSAASTLLFTTALQDSAFAAINSIGPGSIHPKPNQQTGGSGPLMGAEVEFNVDFATDLVLPAGHYFFVPQVAVNDGEFYWLSGQRPIAGLSPDLQAWTRDEGLSPDWLRVGTDIVGAQIAFNGAFSLTGTAVVGTPLPSALSTGSLSLLLCGGMMWLRSRRRASAC
jgi:hypothetical protein